MILDPNQNNMSIYAAKERECDELKIRVAQLEFLYGEATAQLAEANGNTHNKDKNIQCARRGVTPSIPSIAKTQKHQCQFIEDDGNESVVSVSGSDVSVFDDDMSVLAIDDGESIQVKRHTFSELPVAVSSHGYFYDEVHEVADEEEDDVFQDASAKAPTKYNKARYESASRTCLCGGRTSSIKSRAKIHESSAFHQKYLAHNEISSIE
jgi:hypothetical protein